MCVLLYLYSIHRTIRSPHHLPVKPRIEARTDDLEASTNALIIRPQNLTKLYVKKRCEKMFKMFKESVPLVTLILIYFRIILNIMHFIIVFQYYFSSQEELRRIRITYFYWFCYVNCQKIISYNQSWACDNF